MIRFTLFGVQVSIHPTLWLTLAILGRAYMVSNMVELMSALLFIIAAFVVLLAHEMGHALVGRHLGGGHPVVYLAWLGGDCTNESARLTRLQGVAMTAAGPLASLAVGLVAYLGLCLYVGDFALGSALSVGFAFGVMPAEVLMSYPPLAMFFFFYLVEVSCWWTVLNLLPIFPLDGGQIMQGLMKSRAQMHAISLAVAVVLAVTFAVLGLWLLSIFMILLAVLNHKLHQESRHGGTDFR
ncbi:MAG: hypothetical protein E7032_05315 [Akkermansiaceae bacterium]|nr:hypothetical protein [Akkermansiaceae bacterium]